MTRRLRTFHLILSIALVLLIFISIKHSKSKFNTPDQNIHHKWRIGYYEGGPWIDYQGNLVGILHGLMGFHWIKTTTLPHLTKDGDTSKLWHWLSENAKSDHIEFVSDAYWSCAWTNELREKNRAEAIKRLAHGKDIDLMIAAGTWAGQDLANDKHQVPTIVISASNPIQSGIIKSAGDSGFSHIFAKIDPERYIRQLRLFHALTKFKRLGIVYEGTVEGRTYAALEDVEKSVQGKRLRDSRL